MSFAEELSIPEERATQVRNKRRAGKPETVRVEETARALVLSWRWFEPALFFLLFFAIAWDAFLVGWYAVGLTMTAIAGPMAIIMLVFPIAHVAVGVGMTYTVLAGFLNRTRIEVTTNELTVRHGPIPWKGNRRYAAGQVKQLYCKGGLLRINARPNVKRLSKATLHAILDDNTHVTLLKDIDDPDKALYIEQKVEERLGIQDQAVRGELR